MARRITSADLRPDAAEAFAAFDRGEGVEMTPDELMDGIELTF
jgi:hypothetical protein